MLDPKDSINKGDRNKIYFLVIVIIALLGTNAWLFFKDKHENKRFVTVDTEKDHLKLEIEKIELELDRVNPVFADTNDKLQQEQKLARNEIEELQQILQKANLTQGELVKAQNAVKELGGFVKNYGIEIARIQKKQPSLKDERDSLLKSVTLVNKKIHKLVKRNSELNAKIKNGAALKAFNIQILAYKVKNNGKNIKVTHAEAAQKLILKFSIASNPLTAKGYHKIYLRVFDPAGNLIANESNMFEADAQDMQYSDMIIISYKEDSASYSIQWVNPKEFIKGTYAIILYADNYTMGKSSIALK